MNNEAKAQEYRNLMFKYDLLENKVNEIKSLNFELSPQHEAEIRNLKQRQSQIMSKVSSMLQ